MNEVRTRRLRTAADYDSVKTRLAQLHVDFYHNYLRSSESSTIQDANEHWIRAKTTFKLMKDTSVQLNSLDAAMHHAVASDLVTAPKWKYIAEINDDWIERNTSKQFKGCQPS